MWPVTGRHSPPADAAARSGPAPVGRRGRIPAGARRGRPGRGRGDVRARRLCPRAGGRRVYPGDATACAAFYAQLFSNGGGIPLEHCAMVDNGRACALEYNVVRWGRTELPPEAGRRRLRPGRAAASSPRPGSTTTAIRRSASEELTAVDVEGRARQGRVGHEVHRERGDVLGPDDAADRERSRAARHAAPPVPHRGATRTARVDEAGGDEVDPDGCDLEREAGGQGREAAVTAETRPTPTTDGGRRCRP